MEGGPNLCLCRCGCWSGFKHLRNPDADSQLVLWGASLPPLELPLFWKTGTWEGSSPTSFMVYTQRLGRGGVVRTRSFLPEVWVREGVTATGMQSHLRRPCRKLGSTCKCAGPSLGAPSPTGKRSPVTLGPELGSGCATSPLPRPCQGSQGWGSRLWAQLWPVENSGLRDQRDQRLRDCRPKEGTGLHFLEVGTASRRPLSCGEQRVKSPPRIPGLRASDPVPREEAQASGTPPSAPGPGSIHAGSTRWDPGKGGRLSLLPLRGHCLVPYLFMFSFTFFSYFSCSVWKHVPVFFPPTHPLPFPLHRDAQGDVCLSAVSQICLEWAEPRPSIRQPRTPGALGSTTRFQEWGPSAWAGHLRDFFSLHGIQRQRANYNYGRLPQRRSPRKGWAKHPTNLSFGLRKTF